MRALPSPRCWRQKLTERGYRPLAPVPRTVTRSSIAFFLAANPSSHPVRRRNNLPCLGPAVATHPTRSLLPLFPGHVWALQCHSA